jgi:hypothetical protein
MSIIDLFHKKFCCIIGRKLGIKYVWQGSPYIEDIFSKDNRFIIGNTGLGRQLWKCPICGYESITYNKDGKFKSVKWEGEKTIFT